MKISAVSIAPKADGLGSSVNGGELLFLALATCCCNDVYREAPKRGVAVSGVDVTVEGEFDDAGVARDIRYSVDVTSSAARGDVENLIRDVDAIAEIHRALRSGTPVELSGFSVSGDSLDRRPRYR